MLRYFLLRFAERYIWLKWFLTFSFSRKRQKETETLVLSIAAKKWVQMSLFWPSNQAQLSKETHVTSPRVFYEKHQLWALTSLHVCSAVTALIIVHGRLQPSKSYLFIGKTSLQIKLCKSRFNMEGLKQILSIKLKVIHLFLRYFPYHTYLQLPKLW